MKKERTMKKEYKVPALSIIAAKAENQILAGSQGNWVESKKSGRTFEDDEDITPAAPKKFWDDEN